MAVGEGVGGVAAADEREEGVGPGAAWGVGREQGVPRADGSAADQGQGREGGVVEVAVDRCAADRAIPRPGHGSLDRGVGSDRQILGRVSPRRRRSRPDLAGPRRARGQARSRGSSSSGERPPPRPGRPPARSQDELVLEERIPRSRGSSGVPADPHIGLVTGRAGG